MDSAKALLASMALRRVRESFMFAFVLKFRMWCLDFGIVDKIFEVVRCLMISNFKAEVALCKYLSLRFGQHNHQHLWIPTMLVRTSIITSKQTSTNIYQACMESYTRCRSAIPGDSYVIHTANSDKQSLRTTTFPKGSFSFGSVYFAALLWTMVV
jgi:hypothetical protein